MRDADRREIWATGFDDMLEALHLSHNFSTHKATCTLDGELVAIFGVTPTSLAAGEGSPWLIGTDLIRQHARVLIPRVRPYIDAMLRAYPRLENYVHAENRVAVGWLKRVGFTLHPAQPFGLRGELFHRFTLEA